MAQSARLLRLPLSVSPSPPVLLNLAILHDPHGLGFVASDGRGVGVFDRLPHGRGCALPPAVSDWLARQPDGALLQLQLSDAAQALAWESLGEPGATLDQRFIVARLCLAAADADDRRLPPLSLRGPGPRLDVLHLVDGATADEPAQLSATLPSPLRCQALAWPSDAASPPADFAAGALQSLLLCTPAADATVAARRLAQVLAALRQQAAGAGPDERLPRLWLLPLASGTPDQLPLPLLAELLGAGLTLLPVPLGGEPAVLALAPFWQALAEGATLGLALRRLRLQARERGAAAAGAWLLGDAAGLPALAEPEPGLVRAADDDVRQCTMLKCDLVESTALMRRLGDEAYAEGLARYHARVADIVQHHGGLADDPQGDDGFMCYFGFPVAREDAALQALRAGLALASALDDLGPGWRLRIGISTGRVVVRDGQPVGAAVHHAARLQALAQPGEALVADATRQLASERFEFTLREAQASLKGFEQGGAVWCLGPERPLLGTERFDQRSQLTRFVGREAELAAVQRVWRQACAGKRQALLIVGEAGIGKSRLVREFRRRLVETGAQVLECRCTPETAGSALHPVIDLLRRLLQAADGEAPAALLARLQAGVVHGLGQGAEAESDEARAQSLALIAALLSLPATGLPPLPDDAALRRRRTMDALTGWLARRVAQAPLALIVEDVHWIDPSTRELLQRLVDGATAAAGDRLLLLLTWRASGSQAAAAPPFEVPRLPLAGLPPEAACALLRDACGASLLDAEMERWLALRGDGVPLFIEESAHMAAALVARRAQAAPAPSMPSPAGAPPADLSLLLREAVPTTLEALLMARLDQLPSARRAAQLGSAIGRAFALPLAAAVNADADSPIRLADLEQELALLAQAGLVSEQGQGAQRLYVFKHALVRDAAHQSLLERDRKRLHAAIARVLQAQFGAMVEAQPELLARHLELAGQTEQALAGWERAARHAAARSAHDEAIAHLRHALALLAEQGPGTARDRAELRLQLLLASRLIATAGYGADAVEAVYGRALALCEALGDAGARTKARLGLEGWHFMRGDFGRALDIAREVAAETAAEAASAEPGGQGGRLARIQSDWALANIHFHQGQVPQAVAMMDACLADYRSLGHRALAVQDPGVMCLCYSSWGLWEMGRADEALSRARQVVDLATGLNHRFSMGEAHGFLAVAHWFRGELAPGLEAAERAIEICESGGFAVWLAHARVVHGRLLAELGDVEAGLSQMQQGDAMWAATGAVVTRAFYLSLRAEGLAEAGRSAEALALLEQAWALVQRCGERYWAPEVARLTGELLLRGDPSPAQAARADDWLALALREAQASSLQALALRAAMSLGRRLAAQQRPRQAAALLAPCLAALSEGRGTRDLRRARALLVQWQDAA